MSRTRPRFNLAALWFVVVLSLSLGLLSYGQRNSVSGAAGATDSPIFMIPSNYPVGPRAMGITVGDLNGDGRLDLVVPNLVADNNQGQISVLLRNADGSLQSPVTYPSGSDAWFVAIADFNRDGKPDLAVSGQGSILGILLGNGDGTFQPVTTFWSEVRFLSAIEDNKDVYLGGTRTMALADFNGDGLVDIGSNSGRGGTAEVFFGRGDGTFSAALVLAAASSFSQQVVAADLNRDNRPDLLVADRCLDASCPEGGVVVLLGNGDGTFQNAVRYRTGGRSAMALAVGDVNGDGSPDVGVANAAPSEQAPHSTMSVLLGNGSGGLGEPSVYPAGPPSLNQPTSVAIADFNNDGKADISVLLSCWGCNSLVSIFAGDGKGGFRTPPPMSELMGGDSIAMSINDLNQDGNADIAVATVFGGITMLAGNGDGTFDAARAYGNFHFPMAEVLSDFNGDGNADIAVADDWWQPGGASLGVLLGNADGTFRPALNYFTGIDSAGSIAAGDLNHDGAPDVLVGGRNTFALAVLLGDGKGGFQSKGLYPTTTTTNAIDVADFNLDGKLDVVISPGIAKGSGAAMFLGLGDGTLAAPEDVGSGRNFSTVVTGDFNSDGKPDLALADPVQVLLGNGDGTFHTAATYPDIYSQYAALLVRDLNADHKPDLVVSNNVLLGVGDGTFLPPVHYFAGAKAAAADFNGDGVLDLATTHGWNTMLLNGVGDGSFGPVVLYLSPGGTQVGDFNHDGKPDLAGADYSTGAVTVLMNVAQDFHFATATALSSSRNPAYAGQRIVFSASVTPAFAGVVTGTITFHEHGMALGSEPVNNGKATFSTPALSAGQHIITATYGGDTSHLPSTSASVVQEVVADTVPPQVTVSVNPAVLRPPNRRMTTVRVEGSVTDSQTGVVGNSIEFAVRDEYQATQPHGPIVVNAAGRYSFTILLPAFCEPHDKDGRHFRVRVSARDRAGNRAEQWKVVTVPHDER